jgi:hypothetical protein
MNGEKKVNNICELVFALTDDDIAEATRLAHAQKTHINHPWGRKFENFDIGENNLLIIDQTIMLRSTIRKGINNE